MACLFLICFCELDYTLSGNARYDFNFSHDYSPLQTASLPAKKCHSYEGIKNGGLDLFKAAAAINKHV